VAQGVGPVFKPQYHKKKKDINNNKVGEDVENLEPSYIVVGYVK
jgi:hypothetical protein